MYIDCISYRSSAKCMMTEVPQVPEGDEDGEVVYPSLLWMGPGEGRRRNCKLYAEKVKFSCIFC